MRWEYLRIPVRWDGIAFPTGDQGLLGEKTETEWGWWVRLGGEIVPEDELLAELGSDGWELVAVVVSEAYTDGVGSQWYKPARTHYFKRQATEETPHADASPSRTSIRDIQREARRVEGLVRKQQVDRAERDIDKLKGDVPPLF